MLFYIALFVACVIIAVGFLFLYRSLEGVGKVVFRAVLPTVKTKRTPTPRNRNLAATVNDTPTPWGWHGKAKAEKVTHSHAHARPVASTVRGTKTPWGWPGNNQGTHEHGVDKKLNGSSGINNEKVPKPARIVNPDVGWPYREEKFELDGRKHKVVRKVAPKPTDLSKTSKPWGW